MTLKADRTWRIRMEETTRFCFKCGEKISSDVDFCPKCGAKQPNNQEQNTVTPQPTATQTVNNYQEPVQAKADEKTGWLVFWGWVAAVIALFVPIIGVISIVLGAMVIKKHRTVAGTVLIVFAIIFIILGLTGFSEGFFGAI
ncbi:hypothetical protein C5Z26_08345 [Lactobacillus sp. CBA3606]|nr:hypothetical protein C5Z26_08345 [Lactobacillus sp. CBA3606]